MTLGVRTQPACHKQPGKWIAIFPSSLLSSASALGQESPLPLSTLAIVSEQRTGRRRVEGRLGGCQHKRCVRRLDHSHGMVTGRRYWTLDANYYFLLFSLLWLACFPSVQLSSLASWHMKKFSDPWSSMRSDSLKTQLSFLPEIFGLYFF